MIDLPSLLPYLWVTKVEGILKIWVRRVIKSSLVDNHFASPALLLCVVVGKRLIQMAAAAFSYYVVLYNLVSQASRSGGVSSETEMERICNGRGAIKVGLKVHQGR
jgi:hypothetical protein